MGKKAEDSIDWVSVLKSAGAGEVHFPEEDILARLDRLTELVDRMAEALTAMAVELANIKMEITR